MLSRSLLFAGLAVLLFSGTALARTFRVLFIGNSYVAVNDLPNQLRNFCLAGGDTLIVDSSAPGGYTFEAHSTDATTLQKIAAGGWDFVILQEQSQRPAFPPSQVEQEVYPFAQVLDSLIHVSNPCAKTVFFMTWGRKYGDQSNCAFYPVICTYEGMQMRLRESYVEMADDNQALVAPVGMAWRASWYADSTLNLWSGDNSHPSIDGTYLATCVFYATLFGATPVGNTYTAGIAAARVQHYQQIAASVVNDSASTWNIGEFEPQAGFGYSALGNGLFQFTDQSDNAQSISWDFGDGGVSTQASPSHTYTATGIYTVTQVVSDGCTSDTSVQTVNVSLIGIEEAESVDILVFPNPVADMLRVRFNGQVVPERWALYTFDGRLAMEGRFTGQADAVLDLSALPAGSYELLLQQGDKRFRKSLFKR